MAQINENFLKLPGNYLFSEIAKRVGAYGAAHPDVNIIRMGIGDVTRPLVPAVTEAMHKAVDEMGTSEGFRGYGPEQGYEFLRNKIAEKDYAACGVGPDEIFVSDGAKSDCGNIVDIFGMNNKVAVCDPVYPVYIDTNVMAGRAGEYDGERWNGICYMPCTAENGFAPELPKEHVDMIYLCFPNNPTGGVLKKSELEKWVGYARKNGSVILFDSAYEAFITEDDVPHSIYEIDGAKEVAVEFRSFSKTAGFTGTRCAYTVVPKELTVGGIPLRELWNRRQCTKFNGVPYIIQRAAEAVYSDAGQRQIKENIDHYMNNAKTIKTALKGAGLTVFGGTNSPYIWAKTPDGLGSWEFFDKLLKDAGVVTTPGAGFGPSGEGYIRFTAFSTAEDTVKAMDRVTKVL